MQGPTEDGREGGGAFAVSGSMRGPQNVGSGVTGTPDWEGMYVRHLWCF